MNRSALKLLRFGLAATFLLVGILILLHPTLWANLLQPWARIPLHGSLRPTLTVVALVDIAVAILLALNIRTSIVSLVGAVVVLLSFLVMVFNDLSVLAVGVVTSGLALFIETRRK